ncbi:group II intron maturase-specific domain-containing protein [Photorhabdus asymbiotica]|uniref:group II intron maturase-specific domain-containing protein n=1 Tax=Photorhabdus asymbiotica TaxID=291112 RepID=UPI003DA71926
MVRLRSRLKILLKGAQGRKLADTIGELNPVLRGWGAYFSLSVGKSVAEGVDGW